MTSILSKTEQTNGGVLRHVDTQLCEGLIANQSCCARARQICLGTHEHVSLRITLEECGYGPSAADYDRHWLSHRQGIVCDSNDRTEAASPRKCTRYPVWFTHRSGAENTSHFEVSAAMRRIYREPHHSSGRRVRLSPRNCVKCGPKSGFCGVVCLNVCGIRSLARLERRRAPV